MLVYQDRLGTNIGKTHKRGPFVLRTLRVLRLLSSIPQFALIFQSISELTTVFVRLGSVLMVIMVFFGQVGILLFGAANSHHRVFASKLSLGLS